jgi:hypothetical protein
VISPVSPTGTFAPPCEVALPATPIPSRSGSIFGSWRPTMPSFTIFSDESSGVLPLKSHACAAGTVLPSWSRTDEAQRRRLRQAEVDLRARPVLDHDLAVARRRERRMAAPDL